MDLISRQAALDALKSQLSDWNDDYSQAEIPPSFINIKMAEPDEPQRNYVYIFAEAGLNILEPNGIMNVSFSA